MAVITSPQVKDQVLNVNKPVGWTSHDVVARLRRQLGFRKIGHAGTLDPAATGVLPILVGRGTRVAEYLMDWDKEYLAVLRLGQATDTQDATGTVVEQCSTDTLTEEQIRLTIAQFRGPLQQIPPMYSAVKVGGQPLYKAARAGQTIERRARQVTVSRIDVQDVRSPDVSLRIECSKGTYVRTLCADIGERLGVGGHLLSLQRIRVGPLHIQQSMDVEEVDAQFLQSHASDVSLSLDEALADLPALVVDSEVVERILHGASVPPSRMDLESKGAAEELGTGQTVRLKDSSGRLLGLGRLGQTLDGNNSTVAVVKVLVDGSC